MKERELPKGWEWKRLGDIAEINSGVGFPLEYQEESNGEIPVYKVMDISKVFLRGEKYLQKSGFYISKKNCEKINANPFKEGTIVFAKIGAALLLNRRAILSQDALFDNNVMGLTPNREVIDNLFLYYHFLKVDLGEICHTTSVPSIRKSDVEDFQIPLPPLPVQRQIVTVLERAEALKRQRQEADALTGALLQNVFWEMFGDPVRNEKGWSQSKLGDCCRVQRGKFTYRPRNEPRFYGGNYPFIQTGDVANCQGKLKKYTQTLNDEGLSISKMFPKGTIVISIAANIGDTAILDFDSCFPDSVVGISPDNSKGTVEFFEMMMRFYKEHLWNLAPETAQRNINLRILSELEVIIPPLALQQQFARVVQEVERIREQQAESKTEIDMMFDGLMQRAFSGEVVAD